MEPDRHVAVDKTTAQTKKNQAPFMISNFGTITEICKNLGLIFIGNILVAVSVNGILIPHQFLSGGVTGIALLLHYLLPFAPMSWLYFLLNIPLFVLGWKSVGRRFFIYSAIGMSTLTLTLHWVHVVLPIEDKILSALFAGIVTGLGGGFILRSKGSAGGTDILSVILLRRFSILVGHTYLAFNVILLISTSILFSLEAAIYTLIYIYVTSQMMNLVVTGLSKRKAVLIVSKRWQELSEKIINGIGRGLTVLQGAGGYTGQEEQILYTVVTIRDWPQLKESIRNLDPDAFVVVQDTIEVMGLRIGNQPHW